ncbi:MAG: class I SAM-dependent DNA methyltransferase [Dehalococcoidia bacterium]
MRYPEADERRSEEQEDELLEQYLEQFGNLPLLSWLGQGVKFDLPEVVVKVFARHVSQRNARILDAGAGTGSSGELLKRLGYTSIYAIDISPELLEEARRKEIYLELHQMTLGEDLSFPDDYFDGVFSVAVMGQAPPQSFDELIRITRGGGRIVFTVGIARYRRDGFKEKQENLEQERKWRLVEKTEPLSCPPGYDPSVFCYVFVYQVL